jgi:hypothetical protein
MYKRVKMSVKSKGNPYLNEGLAWAKGEFLHMTVLSPDTSASMKARLRLERLGLSSFNE